MTYRSTCEQALNVAENVGVAFLYSGNEFELNLTVKMETRHSVEGQFVSRFPAICNHCGVMAA